MKHSLRKALDYKPLLQDAKIAADCWDVGFAVSSSPILVK